MGCDKFSNKWGKKYPHAVRSWIKNIDELTTFYDFPAELRRLIYTTNPIESFNRTIRKNTKNKNSFPNLKALKKSFYLSAMLATKKWTKKVHNWNIILNQLNIIFDLQEEMDRGGILYNNKSWVFYQKTCLHKICNTLIYKLKFFNKQLWIRKPHHVVFW